jgi:hypothetical protein
MTVTISGGQPNVWPSPTITGNLTFATANAAIIPGSSTFVIRDSTNAQSNLTLGDGGNLTIMGGITSSGGNLVTSLGFLRIVTPSTPASAAASGSIGTIVWDTGFVYVCTASNTWKRVAIATW